MYICVNILIPEFTALGRKIKNQNLYKMLKDVGMAVPKITDTWCSIQAMAGDAPTIITCVSPYPYICN